jgi:hypothetical protein
MPLVAVGRRRPCLVFIAAARHATRVELPADPPTVEEIVAVMRRAGDRAPGLRTRALIVLLWRAGYGSTRLCR